MNSPFLSRSYFNSFFPVHIVIDIHTYPISICHQYQHHVYFTQIMRIIDIQGAPKCTNTEVLEVLRERGAGMPIETSRAHIVERKAFDSLSRKGM